MSIRTIRVNGDPILRKVSKQVKEITPRTEELISDMINDLHDFDGVGLAAVQVGVLKRICIICINPEDLGLEPDEINEFNPEEYNMHTGGQDIVIINPEITIDGGETQTGNEGCLSVPGKYGQVTRPFRITLNAFDMELKPYTLKAEGLLARAIQHEADHMEGIMYIDKLEGELHSNDEEEDEE